MKKSRSQTRKGTSHSQQPAMVEEKKHIKKNTSYTQGDSLPEDIDEMLLEISLKKPKRAYNFYIQEMKEKDKLDSMIETVKLYSKKWPKVSASERKRYEQLAERDVERYQQHLDLVKKHILQKPLKEGATAYRLYIEDCVRKAIDNEEDPKEARKEAAETWKDMTLDERKGWGEKKKEHEALYENLKKSTGLVTSFGLFIRDQMAAAKENEESTNFTACAEKWKKTKQTVKDKYQQYADQENDERAKHRDLYEIAFSLKPRRPLGAYKFFLMECAKEGKLKSISDGGKLWKKCTDEDKQRYQKMAHRERLAYMVKKMEYDSAIKKTSTYKVMSPFNHFVADMKGKVDTSNMEKGGFFNICYKKWSKIDDATKRKYMKMADDEKVEAEKIKEEFKSRVHDKPKRPGNSYCIYITHSTAPLRKQYPNKDGTEIFSLAAEQWKDLSEKQKDKYNNFYVKEVEAYNNKITEYNEKGYYTRELAEATPKPKKTKMTQSRSASKDKRTKKSVKD